MREPVLCISCRFDILKANSLIIIAVNAHTADMLPHMQYWDGTDQKA